MATRIGTNPQKEKTLFGFKSIILLGINAIIGSGIFLLPGDAYQALGPSSILVFLLCALLVMSLALCFAELSSRVSQNGSSYVYVRAAFGDYAGFIVGTLTWVASCLGIASSFAALLTAAKPLFPQLAEPWLYNVVGCSLIVMLFFISYLGVKSSRRVSDFSSIAKLLALTIFILFGFSAVQHTNFIPFVPVTLDSDVLYGERLGSIFVVLFFAFTGFESLPIAAAHMRNPKKNLPIALLVVVSVCTLFYLLIMWICIGILGPALSHTSVPVASASQQLWGASGLWFITLATLISILGVAFSGIFNTPILLAALAEQGFAPMGLARVNPRGSYGVAITLTTTVVLLTFLSGGFLLLATLMTAAVFLQYIPVALAVIKLRRSQAAPAQFHLPFGYAIPIFSVSFTLLMMLMAGWEIILFSLGSWLAASLLYFGYTRYRSG
ncbi:APC family permease [Shewanella sp. 0m-8]